MICRPGIRHSLLKRTLSYQKEKNVERSVLAALKEIVFQYSQWYLILIENWINIKIQYACLSAVMIISDQKDTPATSYVMCFPFNLYDVNIIVDWLVSFLLKSNQKSKLCYRELKVTGQISEYVCIYTHLQAQ